MKIRITIIFLLQLLVSKGEHARACMPMPSPIFDVPSYIDPDYTPPPSSEIRWGRNTMFRRLLADYGTIVSSSNARKDSLSRIHSASTEPEEYASYTSGADLFNSGSVAEAFAIFAGIRHEADSKRSWLSRLFGFHKDSWTYEASTYMMARCKFVLSQNLWSGYGDPFGAVDQVKLAEADSLYAEYLSEYPDGLYSSSARNLKRRYYMFSGQKALLERDVKQLMLTECPPGGVSSPARQIRAEVINEFEDVGVKSIDFANDAPVLAAYAWLGGESPTLADLNTLEGRERDFSGYPGLFHYVRALGLYRLGRFQELLDKTPEESPKKMVVWLSTQLLRARALARVGDDSAAVSALKRMQDVSAEDAIDLEIALLKLNRGDGLWLFAKESAIKNTRNLRVFATYGLSDSELESGLSRPEIGEYGKEMLADELSRRYILSGRYVEMSRLFATGYTRAFNPETEDIARLAADSTDIGALADLGEFLYAQFITPYSGLGVDGHNGWVGNFLSEVRGRCDSCENFNSRGSSYKAPLSLFTKAVETARKTGKRSEAEAKALHYIVMSGKLGDSGYRIRWTYSYDDATKALCRESFSRLHKLYPNSEWAQKTPYYY